MQVDVCRQSDQLLAARAAIRQGTRSGGGVGRVEKKGPLEFPPEAHVGKESGRKPRSLA